ncbi:hypothetical protein NDN08_004248 [Rhodosorus marinus]|uniref:Uncharacterized protein n=1 Tax=Rhodosorus marinus TaxID=101924 RepID=A0AAV8UNU9_9RHOD|nr:hypothetical protein NDN08_004248 [Rhodosorus marinus]
MNSSQGTVFRQTLRLMGADPDDVGSKIKPTRGNAGDEISFKTTDLNASFPNETDSFQFTSPKPDFALVRSTFLTQLSFSVEISIRLAEIETPGLTIRTTLISRDAKTSSQKAPVRPIGQFTGALSGRNSVLR